MMIEVDQRFVIAIFSGFLHPIANQGGLDADGRCPLLWFWHRGSATLQAVIASPSFFFGGAVAGKLTCSKKGG